MTTTERPTTTEHDVPYIAILRATVAFDDFCREVHDLFHDIKESCARHDLTPDCDQLEAFMWDRARQYVGPMWEQEARSAVSDLVASIARPLDGWPDEA